MGKLAQFLGKAAANVAEAKTSYAQQQGNISHKNYYKAEGQTAVAKQKTTELKERATALKQQNAVIKAENEQTRLLAKRKQQTEPQQPRSSLDPNKPFF